MHAHILSLPLHIRFLASPTSSSIVWLFLFLIGMEACGGAETIGEVNLSGSYLRVEKLNMNGENTNRVFVICKTSKNEPLSNVFANVIIENSSGSKSFLTPNWQLTDKKGQLQLPFSIAEEGSYTLTLQIKPQLSDRTFSLPQAYSVVKVFPKNDIEGVPRGSSLNTQILLLDEMGNLVRNQEAVISFSSSDPLAVLPSPIQIQQQDGGSKIVIQGSKLFTLGAQTIWATNILDNRIVSEQIYQVLPEQKSGYIGQFEVKNNNAVADGNATVTVDFSLTTNEGNAVPYLPITLKLGEQGQEGALQSQTDEQGKATFFVTSTTAGEKRMELWIQSTQGFVPLTQGTVTFTAGPLAKLHYLTDPVSGVAGDLISPQITLQAVDAFDNPIRAQAIPVTLRLSRSGVGVSEVQQVVDGGLVGQTTGLLQNGSITFSDIAILQAGTFHRLEAMAPGIPSQFSNYFTISPAPAQQLGFIQQPQAGIAWGEDNLVQVALQDRFGNTVAQSAVAVYFVLHAGSNPATLLYPSNRITSAGLVSFNSAVSTSGQAFVLEARTIDFTAALSQPFDVSAGDPDREKVMIELVTINTIVANNQDAFKLRITTLDAQEKPIVGFPVRVRSLFSQDNFSLLPSVTDSNGQLEISMTSTLAGEKIVSIEFGTFNRIIHPAPVFIAGPITSSGLRLEQANRVADGVAGVLVQGQLQDDYGNPVGNTPYNLTSSIPTDVLTPASGNTDSLGRFQAVVRATQSGIRNLQVNAGNYQSNLFPVNFIAALPSMLHSSFTVTPNSAIADGQSAAILQVTIADAFANPVINAEVLFQASGLENILTNALTYTDHNGQTQAELRTLASQDKTIQAKLKSMTLTASVSFLPKPCNNTPKLSFEQNISTYVINTEPSDIVRGDFNRDSIDDLAVANESDGSVGILLGMPNGTFTNQVTYPTCAPGSLTTLDANHDGVIDIAIVCYNENRLNVLLGQSNGTFTLQNSYPTSGDARSIVSLDSNRDGFDDLAIVNRGFHNLELFLGQGNGSFLAQPTYATGILPQKLVSFDANRDGISDLAVMNLGNSSVGVFIGKQDGTFAEQVAYPIGQWPQNMTTIDVNLDGITDLFLSTTNFTCIFIGKSDGTFYPNIRYPIDVGTSFAVLDINQDGRSDLAVSNYDGNLFNILLGQSDGTFVKHGSSYQLKGYPRAMTVVDANRDGVVDLAVASSVSGTLEVFLGQPNGTFKTKKTYSTGVAPQSLTNLDINKDGLMDFAIANQSSNSMSILLDQKNNTFRDQIIYPTGSSPRGLTAIDLNRDGWIDLAVALSGESRIGIFLGQPGGSFSAQTKYLSGSEPVEVVPIDVNQDTIPDLAVANNNSNSIGLFIGQGNGSFATQVTYPTGNNPSSLLPIHINGDTITDLAVLNTTGASLGIFTGRPDGTFSAQIAYPTGGYPIDLVAFDLNLDNVLDLAVVNLSDNTLSLFIGNSNGTFAGQVIYNTGISPVALATLDADQDGIPDLAVTNASSNTVGLFLGQVNGTLQSQVSYAVGAYPNGLKILDINMDNNLDILTMGSQTSLLLGAANGTFTTTLINDQPSSEVVVIDLDQNYIPEIVLLANSGLQVIERLSCDP